MIDFALTHVDHTEMREIRTCLKQALAAPFTAKQLQKFWKCLDSEIMIPDEKELRMFIGDIVLTIDDIIGPE
jgi:hypothetical protein